MNCEGRKEKITELKSQRSRGKIGREVRNQKAERRAELQESGELVDAKSGLANDGPQRTPVKLLVVRHNDLGKRYAAAQNHVAAFLTSQEETGGGQEEYNADMPAPDTAEFVAQKILAGLQSGDAEIFVHDWMKNRD